MIKTFLKYLLYFLVPLFVFFVVFFFVSLLTGGSLTFSERTSSFILFIFCLLLAGGMSLFVTVTQTRPETVKIKAITPKRKNEILNMFDRMFSEPELMIEMLNPAPDELMHAQIKLFMGIKEDIFISSDETGVIVTGPIKFIEALGSLSDDTPENDV